MAYCQRVRAVASQLAQRALRTRHRGDLCHGPVGEGVLHVVEVKCRRSGALSPPEEAMTPRKFAALMRAAEHYVALYGFDTDTQFDLVTVEYRPDGECDLHYFPNAMTPRW